MKITENKIRLLRFTIATALLIIACPLHESGRTPSESSIDMYNFSGRTVICGIDLGDDMTGGHGLETGLAYEMMKDFASAHNCTVRIVTGQGQMDYINELKTGAIDMVMTHHEGADKHEGIVLSDNVLQCAAIAVTQGKEGHIREINEWISSYTSSEEFKAKTKLFIRPFNPIRRAEKGIIAETVSPYDDLFRKYAAELGWDWRMLAAVVYQESKFSICSRSHRGASGLMQVMPQTAAYYNITDLTDPQQNLIAGTSHLKRLHNLYRDCDMTPEEKIKFTLAAYNAGEGRIKDCRNLAKARHLNENSWSDIVKVIPTMSDDRILSDENVKLGKFKGTETMAYVDNVMALYEAICTISPR